MLLAALALVFVAVFSLVAGAALYLDRDRLSESRAVRQRLSAPLPNAVSEGSSASLLREDERLSGIALLDRALKRWRRATSVAEALRRADVERSVGEFVLATAASAAAGLAVGTFAISPAAGAIGLVLGAPAPWVILRRRIAARTARFEAQLPEAIDAIVTSLHAGYSLPAALEFAAAEIPAPLGTELARVRDEQRLGVEARPALIALAARVDTADVRMFVTSILVQRETGGNLTELLGKLAGLVRSRASFRGRLAALTAEPRTSALVLALLPLAFFLTMLLVDRTYMMPLMQTTPGRALLAGAAVFSAIGYVVMRRLGDVEL